MSSIKLYSILKHLSRVILNFFTLNIHSQAKRADTPSAPNILQLKLSLFLALEELVNESRNNRACKRANDEYPKYAHRSGVALH